MTKRLADPSHLGDHRPVTGRIYSVGYEGLDVTKLIRHLATSKVTLVVDVRLNAISRKPGFSRKALSAALDEVGIAYRHEPDLGNPPENRDSFRRGDVERGRRRMLNRLDNGSSSALMRLIEDARRSRIAVLCVEREVIRCHRHVITERVTEVDPSIEVLEIL